MKRSLAKAVYRISCRLAQIKTPQRIYSVDFSEGVHEFTSTYAGIRWLPCSRSFDLMEWAMRLDPDHFDHWALDHSTCNPVPCNECGSPFCPDSGE